MKRFILSVSVLSTLLGAGHYAQATPAASAVFVTATAAPTITRLPATSLPASVKSYLDQHFAGYALVKVEKAFAPYDWPGDRRGAAGPRQARPSVARPDSASTTRSSIGTRIRFLLNEVPFDLFFDAGGQFAGTHAPGVDKSAYLMANQLPASIRDYLSSTYKGYTFLKAETRPSPTGLVRNYNVDILMNNQRASLHFDSTGTFRDAHIRAVQPVNSGVSYLSRKELPANIGQVLTSGYANQTYVLGEQHTGPNGTDYAVELAASNVLTKLHFDASGNVITRPVGPDGRGPKGGGPQGDAPRQGPGHDRPGHDRPGRDRPGHDRPGHDRPGRDRPGHDRPGHDRPGHDRPGHDRPGHDRPGHDRPGHDRPGHDRPGHDRPGRDRVGQGGPQPTRNGGLADRPDRDGNRQLLLDAGKLPGAVTSYLNANFKGYTFLKADVHTAQGTAADYTTDIAVGKGLYRLRFAANGDVLMAEAKN